MPNATAWDNKIVEYDPAVPLDQLLAHPQNPKVHPQAQTEAVAGFIGEVGWLTGLIVNIRTQHVLDGHDRIKAAMRAGQTTAPVFYVDVPEAMEPLILLMFDPVGWMASLDQTFLPALLAEAVAEDASVQAFLASLHTEEPPPEPGAGGDEFDATPGSGDTRVQPGDIWQVGAHRIGCVSGTDPAAVARLMAGEQADMVFADPPYGKRVVQADMVGADFGVAAKGKYAEVIGDDTTQTAIDAYTLAASLWPDAVHIWWGGNYYANALPPSGCWVVWDKRVDTGIVNTFADAELAWTNQSSPIRVYRQLWNGMIREGEHDTRVHPTQKPVALAEWCYRQYGKHGDIVFDPCAGSGISLIAAERTRRKARLCELSPAYCDVILRRAEAEGIGPIARVLP